MNWSRELLLQHVNLKTSGEEWEQLPVVKEDEEDGQSGEVTRTMLVSQITHERTASLTVRAHTGVTYLILPRERLSAYVR